VGVVSEWFCLRCDAGETRPDADLQARKHEAATSHPTTVHAGLTTLAQCIDEVREQLAAIRKRAQ
jgi:hypothetical protein